MKYLIGLCILTCSVVPGFAATISFNSATGDLGTTHTYGSGLTILATAYGTGGPHLFGKADGGDENGVGLTLDPSGDNEITVGRYVQLDLTSFIGTQLTITMNSTTGADVWSVFASSSALATSGTPVASGNTEATFNVTPSLKYLDFTATSGNVLLSSISYTPTSTPEPVSFALVGSGLLGVYFIRRRKSGSR